MFSSRMQISRFCAKSEKFCAVARPCDRDFLKLWRMYITKSCWKYKIISTQIAIWVNCRVIKYQFCEYVGLLKLWRVTGSGRLHLAGFLFIDHNSLPFSVYLSPVQTYQWTMAILCLVELESEKLKVLVPAKTHKCTANLVKHVCTWIICTKSKI